MNATTVYAKRGDPSMHSQSPTPLVDDGPKLWRDAPAADMQLTPQTCWPPLGT